MSYYWGIIKLVNKNRNIELIKIFGPSILKVSIPKPIIDNLNNYIDQIILDKKKSKEFKVIFYYGVR